MALHGEVRDLMSQRNTVLVGGREVDAAPYSRFLHLLFGLCKAWVAAGDTVRSAESSAERHAIVAKELLQCPRRGACVDASSTIA